MANAVPHLPKKTVTTPVKCAKSSSGSTPSYGKGTLATLLSEDFSQLKRILKGHIQDGFKIKEAAAVAETIEGDLDEER